MGTEEAAPPPTGAEPHEPRRLRRQVRRPGVARPHLHKVKVTDEQEAALVARADELGWTVSRLLVESASSGGVESAAATHELTGEMYRVVRLFGKVANNINQLARVANATGQVQPGAVHALAAIEQVCDRFHQILDEAGRR